MSVVTLESLKAEFEAARDGTLAKGLYDPSAGNGGGGFVPWPDLLHTFDADAWTRMTWGCKDTRLAADLYTIGCDYGLEAAMLFKLSGGNVDPRKPGAQ